MTEPTQSKVKLYRVLGTVMAICAALGLVSQFVIPRGDGPVYWWALTITFLALGLCGVYFLFRYGRGRT